VRRTHRMPFSVACVSRQGRPRPSERRFGASSGLSFSHCAAVRSMLLTYSCLHNSQTRRDLNVFMR
jgi:hypothetical protein